MDLLTVLGDSLAVRRVESGVDELHLYSYLLQEALPNIYVINRARRNTSSDDLVSLASQVYDIKGANSKYFVIQTGIVDCSPRIFSYRRRALLEALALYKPLKHLVSFYISFRSRNRFRITKKVSRVYVTRDQYKSNLKRLVELIRAENPVKAIIIINIVHPNDFICKRSYGIHDHILSYNRAIEELAQDDQMIHIVDLYSYTRDNPEAVLADGQHIGNTGHAYIARTIESVIRAI